MTTNETAIGTKALWGHVELRQKHAVKWLTLSAMFMAMNIAVCTFSIPVPGGHLYLCDTVICIAAILLDPFGAFLVGGVGAFLGDMLFYPAPMFVSLVTHGLQALVISLIVHRSATTKNKLFWRALIATIIGGVIMVIGYTLGKIYVYSTYADAILKLPFEIAQAVLGIVGSLLLCFKGGLLSLFKKLEED